MDQGKFVAIHNDEMIAQDKDLANLQLSVLEWAAQNLEDSIEDVRILWELVTYGLSFNTDKTEVCIHRVDKHPLKTFEIETM